MPKAAPTPTGLLDRVEMLLSRVPLIDGHNDLLWELRIQAGYDWHTLDIAASTPSTQTDLPRLAAGKVGGQFWSVWVPSTPPARDAVFQVLEQVDAAHRMVQRYPDRLGLARTADEVQTVFASGRVASLLGAEGGHSIGCSLAVLRTLYALGVRYMTLTHNDNTPWADSATDQPGVGGLSGFGVEVVREMNRLGMLVDLSHVAPDTMRAALRVSEVPVMFSHSSARALCDHPRNVPDDVLKSLRDNDGVCLATFVPAFVSPACAAWREQLRQAATDAGVDTDHAASTAQIERFAQAYESEHPRPEATLEQVVDHIEHIRDVAGADHVGIGGDFDGTSTLPRGLHDVSCYPALFVALAARGWSDDDLGKLAGANLIRVLRAAEDGARELQNQRGPSLATYRPDAG